MPWIEAMNRFGSDKPDIRFGLELVDVSEVVKDFEFPVFRNALSLKDGSVRGINVKGQGNLGRKQSDKLPLVTAVANKISSLCANYIHLLSNPDKLLVQRTLRDMQSSANDKYVGNIFATAADNMSFKRKKP